MGGGGVLIGGNEGKCGLRTTAPVAGTTTDGLWPEKSCLHALGLRSDAGVTARQRNQGAFVL